MRRLGVSKISITPKRPVRLCGFGFRTGPYEAVRDEIYVRVFDLRDDEERVIFIYGDLLWWNPDFVARMKAVIEKRLSIPGDRLLFVASHNHSGPGTGDTFVPLLESVDEAYADFLQEQMVTALCAAQKDLEPVRLTRSDGMCALNVYRRVADAEGVRMMPNYAVEPDRRLTVFSFYREDGSLKGRIVHYPCHANLSKDNELHPDYPGYALERMDSGHPGSVSIFLQGCTADMRPNCVLGDQFRAAQAAEVREFAKLFCADVEKTVRRERPVGDGSKLRHLEVRLPVLQELSRQEVEARLEDGAEEVRQWADRVLKKNMRDYEVLELNVLELGGQPLYFFNAEVSMYYAAAAREETPDAVCTGYTNGMIGYLCTADQIREGGYEPHDSAVWFAVAGTYDAAVEQVIRAAMKEAGTWKKDV